MFDCSQCFPFAFQYFSESNPVFLQFTDSIDSKTIKDPSPFLNSLKYFYSPFTIDNNYIYFNLLQESLTNFLQHSPDLVEIIPASIFLNCGFWNTIWAIIILSPVEINLAVKNWNIFSMSSLCDNSGNSFSVDSDSSDTMSDFEPNSPGNQAEAQEIISSSDTVSTKDNPAMSLAKRSWVWTHFLPLPSGNEVQCQYTNLLGQLCGKKLKKDKTGSTKSMQTHLSSIHNILDPEKSIQNQSWMDTYLKRNLISALSQMNANMLKTALVYLIASADLPFSFVEQPALRDLLKLCSPQIEGMLVQRNAITAHTTQLYLKHQNHLIEQHIKCQDHISLTTDLWTSPANTSHMSLTAHFINSNFKMISTPLSLIPVEGNHTGAHLAALLFDSLKVYNATGKITAITADNASLNQTMAIELQQLTEGRFTASNSIIGCVAHVINLAAKAALKKFGNTQIIEDSLDSDKSQETQLPSRMSLTNLVTQPDGATVEVRLAVSKISGLAVAINKSSQQKERFIKFMELYESPHTAPTRCKGLICDVQTRWNSTYLMLERAFLLKNSYNQMCSAPEFQKYSLSTNEWAKVGQVIQFLEPLHDATVWLCGSDFPTLSKVIPIYILLIKTVNQMQSQYDSIQLLSPGISLINKLEQYFFETIKKTALICATYLDPRLKNKFFMLHSEFLSELGLSGCDLFSIFEVEVTVTQNMSGSQTHESPPLQPQALLSNPVQNSKRQKQVPFYQGMYSETRPVPTYQTEITQYLAEPLEVKDCDILTYWKDRQSIFPILSLMARKYLAVPGTSCPSERVFSLGRKILHYQRTALSPSNIEKLLLLKEWYWLSGPVFLCPE